jgi:hypothetical protein
MMTTALAVATLLSFSLTAEAVEPAPVAEVAIGVGVAPADHPRFRLGVGGGVLAGIANGASRDGKTQVSAASLAPALQLDLGIQFSRHGALYLRGEAGSVFLLNHACGYLIGEWTPLRWISVGTGAGIDGMADLWIDGAEPKPGETVIRNSWTAVSVPLVIGLQFISEDDWNRPKAKPALRIGLEGAVGVEPTTGVVGWHAGLSISFVMM